MSAAKKLSSFKSELLKISGSFYVDKELYFRENPIPYDTLANVGQLVKIVDDSEAELISLLVLEIPSSINNFHYVGYVLEDGKYSKIKKGHIIGFKHDTIYRLSDTFMEFTKEISQTYLLFIQNTRL